MFKKNVLTIFGMLTLTLGSVPANAEELNLVCLRETPTGLDIKGVLVGDEQEYIALERSSNDSSVVKLKQYAVVITLIPGEGPDGVATEEWEVLSDEQFKLTEQTQRPGFDREWNFVVKRGRKQYDCSPNREAYANPALSRNN